MEKIDYPYRFINAQKIKQVTFDDNIPSMEKLQEIEPGDKVKISNGKEQFLVKIEKIDNEGIQGKVENFLLENTDYDKGDHIRFRKDNVLHLTSKMSFKKIISKYTEDEIIDTKKNPSLVRYFPYTKNKHKLLFTREAFFSTSYPKVMAEIINTIQTEIGSLKNLVVTDATANVGGSAIGFANVCKFVNAVEINPLTFKVLKNNIDVFNLKNVQLYNEDYLKIMHNLTQDIVFIDPPWGGVDYKEKNKLMLYLSDIPLWKIVLDLKKNAKLISLKVPLNFDKEEFEKNLDKTKIKYYPLAKLLIINYI